MFHRVLNTHLDWLKPGMQSHSVGNVLYIVWNCFVTIFRKLIVDLSFRLCMFLPCVSICVNVPVCVCAEVKKCQKMCRGFNDIMGKITLWKAYPIKEIFLVWIFPYLGSFQEVLKIKIREKKEFTRTLW